MNRYLKRGRLSKLLRWGIIMALVAAAFLVISCGQEDSASNEDRSADQDDRTSGQVAVTAAEGSAAGTWGIRGFSFPAWWFDNYSKPAATDALDGLAATGANWVAIIPTQFMSDSTSISIEAETAGMTASEESLVKIIGEAHARGLRVMLKPHVDAQDGTWRGSIQPADTDAWFQSYREMITSYARLAEQQGVEMLCIGTELKTMDVPEFTSEWEEIIRSVREAYSGELTYAATTNTFEEITFWPGLDYLGLDFYDALSDQAVPTAEELVSGWSGYYGEYDVQGDRLGRIEAWQARWQKPVIFTEIGYRSIEYAAREPWDFSSAGVYSGEAQANAYQAAYEVLKDKPWVAGMFWWSWSVKGDNCGAGNADYSICGKPAEGILKEIYGTG